MYKRYIFVIVVLLWYIHKSYYNIIVSRNKGIEVLQKDDGYFARFTKNDYIARNIKTIDQYKRIISNSVSMPTIEEVFYIRSAIRTIDNTVFKNEWFDNERFHALKWKIIVVNDKLYENGYSHTRGDCIIIHKKNLMPSFLTNTLFHEQLHIYQRTYKNDMKKYLSKHYKKVSVPALTRANPDTDGFTYENNKGIVYKALYDGTPSFENVTYYPIDTAKYEHPYEMLAYTSADKYFGF